MQIKYFVISVLFFLFIQSFAHAKDQIVIKQTKGATLCLEIQKLLQLPENKSYLSTDLKNKVKQELFFIPASSKNFSQVVWHDTTEEDMAANAPEQYKIAAESNGKKFAVKKADLQLYPNGPTLTFYLANWFSHTMFTAKENKSDPISRKFSDVFHRNALPFYYKNRLYLSDNLGSALLVHQMSPYKAPDYLWIKDYCVLTSKKQ